MLRKTEQDSVAGGKNMSKVVVFDHPLIQHKLSIMRDRNTVGELQGEELTQERVMRTIAGGEA